jgi:hypothetical protein
MLDMELNEASKSRKLLTKLQSETFREKIVRLRCLENYELEHVFQFVLKLSIFKTPGILRALFLG